MIPTASNITAMKHKKEHVPNTCSLEGILLRFIACAKARANDI